MPSLILRRFDNHIDAHQLCIRLQHDGVPAFLKDETTITLDPLLSNALGGIKVMVPEAYKGEATELLQAYDTAYRQAAVCPKCQTSAFTYQPKASAVNWLAGLLSLLTLTYPVQRNMEYVCDNCGYRTDELPTIGTAETP